MKISLVIPTRQRAIYLKSSLLTALAIDDDNLEIVVSDNCSTDETQELVNAISDPRLIYTRPETGLSMRGNFEHGLAACSGDYVSFIGDDDGYLPGQFASLRRILSQARPDCLFWTLPSYTWPDQGISNSIKLRRRTLFQTPQIVDMDSQRVDLMKAKITPINWAPAIYHGMVSREYLQRVAIANGTVFGGNIPDIYFGYRALIVGGNVLRVDHPFSLGGQSPASNGKAHVAADVSSTATGFMADNASDPLRDVLPQRRSIPWVLFSTLQTARARTRSNCPTLDYVAWYRYILNNEPHETPEQLADLIAALRGEAERTGTQDALNKAIADPQASHKGLIEKLSRELSNFRSVKLRMPEGEDGTILHAVRECDRVLGNLFDDVQSGRISRAKAWRQLVLALN
ncbi:glycosyltransferase [Amylibacter sp.]|nr:glycosyltransferase [Amylibacter sp.]